VGPVFIDLRRQVLQLYLLGARSPDHLDTFGPHKAGQPDGDGVWGHDRYPEPGEAPYHLDAPILGLLDVDTRPEGHFHVQIWLLTRDNEYVLRREALQDYDLRLLEVVSRHASDCGNPL
jgi:hypothetical protein